MHRSEDSCSRLRDLQVIVTSYLFPGAKFDEDRLRRLAEKVGKERLVVDVRCVVPTLT